LLKKEKERKRERNMRGRRKAPPSSSSHPPPPPSSSSSSDDLSTLVQCFRDVEEEVVEEVYRSCHADFEKAFQALTTLQDEGGGGGGGGGRGGRGGERVAPAVCLAFLIAVFDRLNPQFVEDTFIRSAQSVEGMGGGGRGAVFVCVCVCVCVCVLIFFGVIGFYFRKFGCPPRNGRKERKRNCGDS
jgi:hypothetical protein